MQQHAIARVFHRRRCRRRRCRASSQVAAAQKGVVTRNKYIGDAAGAKKKWQQRKEKVDAELEVQRKEQEAAEGGCSRRYGLVGVRMSICVQRQGLPALWRRVADGLEVHC